MKDTIVIIHFQPIEFYPPILNIINFIAEKTPEIQTFILTTKPADNTIVPFTVSEKNIKILSYGRFRQNDSGLKKAFNYIFFYSACFFQLLIKHPGKILYVETLSSLPAYLYKRYVKRSTAIFIHYHEYTSAEEYKNGMTLSRIFHAYEKYLLPRANWVSHTNETRMKKFKEDILPVKINKSYILPNYPPVKWQGEVENKTVNNPKAIVYVGALGMDSMYIKEFAEWVEAQEGKVIWDIFSQQNGDELVSYLLSIKSRYIHFKGMVNYYDLPGVLRNYDVGVILYKGHIPNFIHNAPNKLFEYLACGLDVWFPLQMDGGKPYITQGVYPQVIALNFEALGKALSQSIFLRTDMIYRKPLYYCENVLPALIQQLSSNVG